MKRDHELLLSRWAERLRHEEPRAVAVLCQGSFARGEAEAHSDLDLNVLLDDEVESSYRSAFDPLPDGRLLHGTIETLALAEWLDERERPAPSEEWAFFLAARQQTRLLWATPEARRRLAGRLDLELALSPQLQDLLEGAAKVRNAAARGDSLGLRLAAHDMAVRCPALLALLNPPAPVNTRREALATALTLGEALPGYREVLLDCLGLGGAATVDDELHDGALRLAVGVVAALERRPELVEGWVEPGLPEALADGRLMRLLTQL